MFSQLLERLGKVEEKLETLSTSSGPDRPQQDLDRVINDWTISASKNTTPSSAIQSSQSYTLILPTQLIETGTSLENESSVAYTAKTSCQSSESPKSYGHFPTVAEDFTKKANYLNRTPFSCEECRPILPEAIDDADRTESKDILVLLVYFFEHTCTLFPIICDQATYMMASVVGVRGFRDELQSCLILLMIALSKAYRDHQSLESGLADFQRAVQVLSRLSVQFTLPYAQAQVLAALFLFKKGRLLNFWSYLNAGCTALSVMIQRDENLCRERSPEDIKTTLRLYWICYNLERDLVNEIGSFPRSSLYQLEDRLPLPLGCDESDTASLSSSVRTVRTYTFFLAEMSLKSTLARIISITGGDSYLETSLNSSVEISPLMQELNAQIGEWVISLPSFLDWSPEPTRGTCSPIATRLKLIYWFTRLSLSKSHILHVLHDSDHQLPFLGWKFFQDGILAGVNMIKVSVMEESEVDVIMGNRLASTISLLKDATAKGCCPTLSEENGNVILQECIDMLWRQLAYKSEWITCRLHAL
ncbi:uncharacterized protein BP5553_07111 [Venustampulla echinocandica]|uniref:Transcription factor domain-containing protein n=1 Tax=Venustampulla echinocandica TaxID=2656787 RepID=A0A370TIL6_9HELO|nr:uncharacterized protein BP5553_07111 [Venustampulla echinocandica]RDL35180.1 hypothetical protein BP5553_07111 [Venustampulla echinocandica]